MIKEASLRRYYIVRTESRNEAKCILLGTSFYPLEFLKRELSISMNQSFVIVFSITATKEFYGCAMIDPKKRQGNKLVVEKVSEKSLWHSCYRGWTAMLDQEVVRELNAGDGEYLYNYFRAN